MLPTEKRIIADRLLAWLKENELDAWSRAFDMLKKASFALNWEVYDLWKGYDVLLIMGRVERLSSHKSAARVIDWRPLSEPASAKTITPEIIEGLKCVKGSVDALLRLVK
ncbi:MAG: hypothetical protein WC329_01535 [Candidatus Omnitrophota bacterium]|jgi:hypothetical protein